MFPQFRIFVHFKDYHFCCADQLFSFISICFFSLHPCWFWSFIWKYIYSFFLFDFFVGVLVILSWRLYQNPFEYFASKVIYMFLGDAICFVFYFISLFSLSLLLPLISTFLFYFRFISFLLLQGTLSAVLLPPLEISLPPGPAKHPGVGKSKTVKIQVVIFRNKWNS